ncbi:MAG: cytochrome P450 [Pseudomonadota bacterium]
MNAATIEEPATSGTPALENAFANVSSNYRGTGDFYAICKQLRENSPVMRGNFAASMGVPNNAGLDASHPTVSLFKYKDVMAVMRDPANFTSGFIAEGLGSFFDGLIIIAMDGEEHKKTRALLQPVFTPDTANRWRDRLTEVMRTESLLPMVPLKKADLMDFGLHFPIRAIYSIMGFPDDQPEKIKQYATWALAILAGPQVGADKQAAARAAAIDAAKALYHAVLEIVQQRRATGDTEGHDLISRLIRSELEGRKLDDHEIATFVRSLLPAAGETTTRTFSSILTLLLERPALLERVRKDRSLIAKVIDETVRYEPVATFKVRQAAKDLEIGGLSVAKGSMVQCITAAASRDPEVFERPDEFDIDRPSKLSFGFGFGAHMCIGQFVAKMELTVALNAIFDLFPNLRLDPDYPAPTINGVMLRGASAVHVIWD